MLFWDNDVLRFVVIPLRTWIDPVCSICVNGDNSNIQSDVSVEQFIKETESKYSKSNVLSALKLKLFVNGINTYSRQVANVSKYIDKALEKKHFNLEELATAYGLSVTRTKLRKKLDGLLADE